jgi:hypothetical protein
MSGIACIIRITSHSCDEAGQTGFWHRTGGLKVTVSSGNLWLFSPTGTRTCAPHIRGSSRAVSEWETAYLRQLIIQTFHILQLDSAVTNSLPRGNVLKPFQPYFPITWPGSITVTPPYQGRRHRLMLCFEGFASWARTVRVRRPCSRS